MGAAGLSVAITVESPIAFASGSVMAGQGAGPTFNGSLRGIAEVTTLDSRSGVFSAQAEESVGRARPYGPHPAGARVPDTTPARAHDTR